jgi:hypothetical protein
VGLFELALPETLRKQVIKQGSFSKLRNAGPNVLVLLNFGDLKENITNNGLNGFSVTFHRRSSSTFNFLGSADIASFRRTLFDMGEQGTMELSGNVAGEAPFVVVKSQGQVERKGITETLKWKIEVKTDIIKAKKRKSSKVKR